ncbi:HD domain-containing phosphohydrolase [Acetobacterium bakii]|nr:HD domain-containing phosphohydrolase [Acetobacterium bakii]
MTKKSISIRMILILLFLILTFSTVGMISYIIFSNWLSSASNTFIEMASDFNGDILEEVDEFIKDPMHINDINHHVIENEIIDLSEVSAREAFFVNVIKTSNPNIYSFSYGQENGDYYGARRNQNREIEILRNNADSGFNSLYYSVNEDLTAGDLVLAAGQFDPRTREWYKAAKECQGPIFSQIYKHFIMDDLTVSAAYPIYNATGELEGVMGTHLILTDINDFLKEIATEKEATAIIIEKESGNLVANSFDHVNFITLEDGNVQRTSIGEIDNSAILKAYENYRSTGETFSRIKTDNGQITVKLSEYNQEGLSWLVITAIPESIVTAGIYRSIQLTMGLTLLALIISGLIFFKLANMAFKSVSSLIETTEKFSNGDLTIRAVITRDDEIGQISVAFNSMADTIYNLVHRLEAKVSERTRELEESNDALEYLSYHDKLTGLYNRFYFENIMKSFDTEKHLPLGLVFGDVNGLKLTNDIFGHVAGDALLSKVSEILNKVFRKEDIIARVGGDEFAILLKNTHPDEVHMLMARVKTEFSNEHILALKGSISMGCDTKTGPGKSISDVLKNAEDAMYRDKTLNRKSINSGFIESIIATLHNGNPREVRHSQNVSELSQRIGRAMDLSEAEIKRLKEAGFLHDIGKVVLDNEVLSQKRVLTEEERKLKHEHAVVGYRVLNMFDETLDLAESVFAHHERWDGSGYPKGLKGEEIPELARIIALAESYDAMTNPSVEALRTSEEAIRKIKNMSGIRFDPDIVNVFVKMMKETK